MFTDSKTTIAAAPFTMASLALSPVWLCWREELNAKGKVTKPPRQPTDPLGDHASTNDFNQQTTREIAKTGEARLFQAMTAAERARYRYGTGTVTGSLTEELALIGVDYDACVRPDRSIESWTLECIDAMRSYAEASVNDSGMHNLALCPLSVIEELRAEGWITTPTGTMNFTMAGAKGNHPPRIEVYLGTHFITVSDKRFEDHDLRVVSKADIVKVIEVGRRISGRANDGRADKAKLGQPPNHDDGTDIDLKAISARYRDLILGPPPEERSDTFQSLIAYFKTQTRFSADQVTRLLEAHATPGPQSKYTERMEEEVARSWKAAPEPIERRPLPDRPNRREIPPLQDACDLRELDLPAIEWTVPNLIVKGALMMIAGFPKAGKSVLALAIAIACARGGTVLGEDVIEPCGVLYISVDDKSQRRMKHRLLTIEGNDQCPRGSLLFQYRVPSLNDGLLEWLESVLDANPWIGLVVIDVLGKVRDDPKDRGSLYLDDLRALGPIADLAVERNIAIVLLHHLNKLGDLSGTTGIKGSVDNVLVIHKLADNKGRIVIEGRDFDESYDKNVIYDPDTYQFHLDGDYRGGKSDNDTDLSIMHHLREGPMKRDTLAKRVGIDPKALDRRVKRLAAHGKVEQPTKGIIKLMPFDTAEADD